MGQKPMVYYTGKPIDKGTGTRAINKTGYWSANNDFRRNKKQNKLLTQPFFISKSFGLHILLQSITIRATAIALKVIKCKAGKQFTFHDDAKSAKRAAPFLFFGVKKGIKFRDWSVLNWTLFFKRLNFLKHLDILEKGKMHINVISQQKIERDAVGNFPIKLVLKQFVNCQYIHLVRCCHKTLIFFCFFLFLFLSVCDLNFLYGY